MRKIIFMLMAITSMLTSTYISAKENPNIAKDLMARYNDKAKSCSNGDPAYKCSGVMIRGINKANNLPHAWSLKPENKQKESFAFAYLRADINFSSFPRGYDAGFIMFPQNKTPSGKNTYKVYCAFPVDGGTDGRSGHGCGLSNNDPISKHCDKQGINTFNKWVTHFKSIMSSNDQNFISRQCAFDMTLMSTRTSDFNIVVQANQYIQKNSSKYYMRNNELLVHAWNENNASPLPIEAFFYIIGSQDGLKTAQEYQKDYYQQANKEFVPIVGITLPKTPTDQLTVKYNKGDQAVNSTTPPVQNTITYTHQFNRVGMNGAFVGFGSALPNNYSFVANKQYKLEITMPSGAELLTCSNGSFLNGVCGATQIKEYSYSNGIFTPYRSGVLNGSKLIGNKNFKIRAGASGTIKFKLTPM